MKMTQGDMAKLNADWQSPEVLLQIFDNVSDALVLYDKNHVIRGVNAAAEQMLCVSAEELVGRDCRQMFHCEECEPGCGLHPGLVQLNGSNGAVRLHTPNGYERLVVLKTTPLRSTVCMRPRHFGQTSSAIVSCSLASRLLRPLPACVRPGQRMGSILRLLSITSRSRAADQ